MHTTEPLHMQHGLTGDTTTSTQGDDLNIVHETGDVVYVSREPTPNELRVQAKLQALAAMATLGAMSQGELKELHNPPKRNHNTHMRAPAFGVCVGRDSGRDPLAEQPRNEPCKCGSGKKAKKCCTLLDKQKKFEAKKREMVYKYVGNDDTSLMGETALGVWYAGQLKVQVDNTSHPWGFGWHITKASDWELLDQ